MILQTRNSKLVMPTDVAITGRLITYRGMTVKLTLRHLEKANQLEYLANVENQGLVAIDQRSPRSTDGLPGQR